MYAIVRAGAKQQKVAVGDVIEIDKVETGVGESLTLPVVMVVDGHDHGQGQRLTHRRRDPVDLEDVAQGDLVLGGACAHDRVHRGLLHVCFVCGCGTGTTG